MICNECPFFYRPKGYWMITSPEHLYCEVRDGNFMPCHKDLSTECGGAIWVRLNATKRFLASFFNRWK